MKKLYVVLYMLFLIILSSFVSADLTTNIWGAWTFNEDVGYNANENGFKFTNVGTVNVSGISGTGLNFTRSESDKVTSTNNTCPSGSFTINIWYNSSAVWVENYEHILDKFSGTTGIMFYFYNTYDLYMDYTYTGGIDQTAIHNMDKYKWYMITLRFNGTAVDKFVNGTLMISQVRSDVTCASTTWALGWWAVSGNYWNGLIDELTIWDKAITNEEVTTLWNSGVGVFYPSFSVLGPGVPATPTIENPTPVSGYTTTTNVTLNVSHSTANNDVRYYLYLGTNTTLTESNLYLNNITRNASEWKSFYTNLTTNTYYYKWKVQNVTNGLMSDNTTQRTLTLTPFYVVKFYFYDEKSNGLISGETFNIYLEKTGFSNTYTTSINPYSLSDILSGLYTLKVSSTNYPERQYFDLSLSVSTPTDLNVYLINTTDSSEISFHIMDSSSEDIEDVDVGFYRVISGVTTNIAEEKTDYGGKFKLYLDTDYEYTINFSKSGYAIKTINLEPTLTDSPYSIYLDDAVITVPPFVESYLIRRINYTMTYTNATKTIFFEWNDNNDYSDSMCLDVIDLNTTYFSNCSTAASSSFTYAVTGSNQTYMAKSTAKKNERTYVMDIISINLMEAYVKFGIDSLIIDWIVFLTLAFMGLFHPIASIIMGSIGLIGMYLIGLLPVGFSSIMGIIFVSIIIIIGIMKDERG